VLARIPYAAKPVQSPEEIAREIRALFGRTD
jgi:mitochondrial fission protein ELM1